MADERLPGPADPDGDQQDLADRMALTRVPGMSTELQDESEVEYRSLRLERVVLISVWTTGTADDARNAMIELKALAEAAGSQVLEGLVQRRSRPDAATYLGAGKVDELREVVVATGADTVIADGELSPAQLRNLEDRVGVKVVDRTALILDIFAQHARSVEGRTQVELAQLTYLKQRLRGWGDSLSRQVGGRAASGVGIGGRGPGETRLETDRRRINARIAVLRRRLRGMDATRALAAEGAGLLVEDALFATLDPTTRRCRAADGRVYTMTDTVGFVRHLPTELVEAFRSTLEESVQADLLVHVVDGSDPDPEGQITAVREVLDGIGAGGRPELLAVNKTDLADPDVLARLRAEHRDAVLVSARTGEGVDALREAVESALPAPHERVDVLIPWDRGDLVDRIHRFGEIESDEYLADGTRLVARVHADLAAELAGFAVAPGGGRPE